MKKETLIEIILGTIGGLVFSMGMCMSLIPEWNLFTSGVIVSIIGFIILLCIIPVYKRNHPGKGHKPINWGIVVTWLIGISGSLIMGYGMSRVMIDTASKSDMIIGLITSIIGLIICVLNYPIYSYLKKDN